MKLVSAPGEYIANGFGKDIINYLYRFSNRGRSVYDNSPIRNDFASSF